MGSVLASMRLTLRMSFRARATLQLEILALRHQLQIVTRSRPQRMRLTRVDPLLWVWMSQVWDGWQDVIVIVKRETVLAWHRRGFRLFWTWKSRRRLGRPSVPRDVRELIRTTARANRLWGARFSRIMSTRSWLPISSSCQPPRIDSSSYLGIHEVLTAPRSSWQNGYAERLIGAIRRECLHHVIVVNETGLSRVLSRYLAYYHDSRTHLSRTKDSPEPRPIAPPTIGPVVAIPQVGGLHHRDDRRAA